MTGRQVPPQLGAKSFECPTCGANAHQDWFKLLLESYPKDRLPDTVTLEEIQKWQDDREIEAELRDRVVSYLRRRLSRALFIEQRGQSAYLDRQLENCYVSRCYSCSALAIWVFDQLIHPAQKVAIDASADMPREIRLDFEEAARIVNVSARGAAALLRLAIQKLMKALGEKGENINDDIASLVRKGLDPRIQRALDIVRVVGNEAVHPGQIDLRDDNATAMQLFALVNLIVDNRISQPNQIDALYEKLPAAKLRAIQRRDKAEATK